MLSEHIKIALASVRAARLRSFLTMIGVIVAVVGVITIFSLGEGIKHQVSGQSDRVGQDLITVRPGKIVDRNEQGEITGINWLSFITSSALTSKDLEVVKNNQNIEMAVPVSVINGVPQIGQTKFGDGFIMATTNDFPEVSSQKVEFGNFFDQYDTDRRVAVIGQGVAEKLFKENVPVSKSLQIRGENFVVSGVFERVPANPLDYGADYNDAVFIPYNVGEQIIGDDLSIYEIMARPTSKDPAKIDEAIAGLNNDLRNNHGGQDDFTVLRQEEMVAVADSMLKTITRSLSIIAGVSLLVGGVSIMNVMLVAVTERTREIGIRKAVGATNRQIQKQFLIEAVVISAWGAFVGIVIAFALNFALTVFTNLQPVIAWQVVVGSALSAVAVGVVFGLIPAIKASRKDPIEALRRY
jgi:putative ABC transport system permease protein